MIVHRNTIQLLQIPATIRIFAAYMAKTALVLGEFCLYAETGTECDVTALKYWFSKESCSTILRCEKQQNRKYILNSHAFQLCR